MSDYDAEFRLIKNKLRSKKLNHNVDLTAMVSISFLLIVFFMVSLDLLKPKCLNLGLPENNYNWDGVIVCGNGSYRTTTLILDDNNKIISYKGNINFLDEKPKTLSYGKDGIRKELLNFNLQMLRDYGKDRGAIVIIKPSKKSNYGNLVDILDEMSITSIATYIVIDDFLPEELNLLASN